MRRTLTQSRALALAGSALSVALAATFVAWGAPSVAWFDSQAKSGCEHCGKAHKGTIDVRLLSPEWEAARMTVQHRLHDIPVWGGAEVDELMGLVQRARADASLVPQTELSRGAELVLCWMIQEVGARLSIDGICDPEQIGELRSFVELELSSALAGARFNAADAVARAGMLTDPRLRSIVEGLTDDPDPRVAEECRRMLSGAPEPRG